MQAENLSLEELQQPNEGQVYFVYYGQEGDLIPGDVTHVIIHSSVRAIKNYAFKDHRLLIVVILNTELEEIGEESFAGCSSLLEIILPKTVKKIAKRAYFKCSGLMAVTLGDGLEEI